MSRSLSLQLVMSGLFAALTLPACTETVTQVVAPSEVDGGTEQSGSTGSTLPPPPPDCVSDADCTDQNACNGVETCEQGYCVAGPAVSCDDGVMCTRDLCDPIDGKCTHRPPDADGDGVADAKCIDTNGAPLGTDCDDANAARFPGNPEVCLVGDPSATQDEDCNPKTFGTLDADSDGFVTARCANTDDVTGALTGGTDCDDDARSVHPGASEVCDRFDNNCNGTTDEGLLLDGYFDEDGDGYGRKAKKPEEWTSAPNANADDVFDRFTISAFETRYRVLLIADQKILACPGNPVLAQKNDDCGDNPSSPDALYRHDGAIELCDGVDNDCDGLVDENVTQVPWYRDKDADGFGTATSTPGDQASVVLSCARQDGYSLLNGDCADLDDNVNPRAVELCNGRDDNCDGSADFVVGPGNFENDDGDRFPDPLCGTLQPDCDDNANTVYPGAPELCDQLDNDCNGVADTQTSRVSWYVDLDRDGFGDAKVAPVLSCETVADRVLRAGDCNDASSAINPNAKDDCSGAPDVDDNCDGKIDEGQATDAFFRDADKDGYGAGDPLFACAAPVGYAASAGDCDDSNSTRRPSAAEICNPEQGVDDDCDGAVDCLDTGCTSNATCQSLFRIRVKDPVEPLTGVLGQPFDVTIEVVSPANNNAPINGAELTLTCDDATWGVWASPKSAQEPRKSLTNASGLAVFKLTPGQSVGAYACTVSAGNAVPKTVNVNAIAPQVGTIFTAANASITASTNAVQGSAIGSPLYYPNDIVFASDGTAYVAGGYNYRVMRISPRGSLSFFAGKGQSGSDGDGAAAISASFTYASKLALDETRKRLYVVDGSGKRVRMINLVNNNIYLYAGSGSETTFNGGAAISADITVGGIEVANDGSLFLMDTARGLLKVALNGAITVAVPKIASCTNGFYGCSGFENNCDVTRGPDGSLMMLAYLCEANRQYVGLARFDPVTNKVTLWHGGAGTTGDGQALGTTDLGAYNYGLTRDSEGNVYVAQPHRVRRIDHNTHIVTTVLGTGTAGNTGDFGPYAQALLNDPRSVAFDPSGSLWITERGTHRLRRIWRAPEQTLAPLSIRLTGGDRQQAYPFNTLSPVSFVTESGTDPAGGIEVYFEEEDRAFSIDDTVSNFDGQVIASPQAAYTLGAASCEAAIYDLDGNVIGSAPFDYEIVAPPAGTITPVINAAQRSAVSTEGASGGQSGAQNPTAVAAGPDGTIFYTDSSGRLYSLDPAGIVHYLAGGGSGNGAEFGPVDAKSQSIGTVYAITYYHPSRQVFIASSQQVVYRVDVALETIEGLMGFGTNAVEGGPALTTDLVNPYSLGVDNNGTLYIGSNDGIWAVDTTKTSPTAKLHFPIAPNCTSQPAGTLYSQIRSLGVAPDGDIYAVSYGCPSGQLVMARIPAATPTQKTLLTASGGSTAAGPLDAKAAQIGNVFGNMSVDGTGNVYFAEVSLNRVRRLTPTGKIEPIAGTGVAGGAGNFGPALSAQLYLSSYGNLATLANGDVVIADYVNHTVRRVWSP